MRKSFVIIFIWLLFVSQAFGAGQIVVDGAARSELKTVYRYNGTDYLSADTLFGAAGFTWFWNEISHKLVFKNESGAGVLSPYSSYVTFGTRMFYLKSRPLFLGGALFVPEKFATEILFSITGKKVELTGYESEPAPAALGMPYRPLYLKRIVIDPGHGGHDSGAVSPTGLKEKDIVLKVSHILAKKLQEEMGIEVIMTRKDDRFITLGDRARIANTSGADLFFCIHANGAFNRSATGTETFFLSFEASDRKAAKLAAAENASLRFEQGNPLKNADIDDLKLILWDMVQADTMKESEKLAISVQSKLQKLLHLPSRGVKQAPFYVLMGSAIPAILVEIGFITTSAEANQLADVRFQEKIADALFLALVHYDTSRAVELQK